MISKIASFFFGFGKKGLTSTITYVICGVMIEKSSSLANLFANMYCCCVGVFVCFIYSFVYRLFDIVVFFACAHLTSSSSSSRI